MRPSRVATAILLVLILSMAAGCSSIAEQAAEEIVEGATGADVEVDDEKVTITGEEGETLEIEGSDSEIPEGFPSDMPVYDADVEGSSTLTSGEGTSYYISLRTEDDFETVAVWYKDELKSEGWEIVADSTVNVDGLSSALMSAKKAETEAALSVVQEEDGGVTVTTSVMAP